RARPPAQGGGGGDRDRADEPVGGGAHGGIARPRGSERNGDGGSARLPGGHGQVPPRPGARGAAAPPAGLRAMSDPSHERAVATALTEALQRLPPRPAPTRLVRNVD